MDMASGSHDARSFAADTLSTYERPKLTPHRASVHEVREEAQRLSISVLSTYRELVNIQNKHGATLAKRWMKAMKDPQKREKWLRQAYSKIPPKPLLCSQEAEQFTAAEYATACLCSPINLEDLMREDTLLHFIFNCSSFPPSDFAHAELVNTGFRLHKLSGVARASSTPHCA
ncbi:hypothetical protein LTR36_007683 [Oleoguttula mirabilis]|uniref:Uncharacterized protein n=1 Tax=Oleoguttula mirabilis TaxID=1507867 RepID=A0AAV9JVA2_9PEZI|nr:hypothetical protein LTR36_007683 [Oleoguttula mirabilis]